MEVAMALADAACDLIYTVAFGAGCSVADISTAKPANAMMLHSDSASV